ncbi:MAG TPA: 7,8-didemethyl-8-hydroxy-5-deazariboflavin synthase CofG [Nitrososphaeraceae archaeon]
MFSCSVEKEITEVLHKCMEDKPISKTDYLLLFKSENTHSILHSAKLIRDRFKPGLITYSPKVFINLINLCRDTCSYCTYKKGPTDAALSMLSREQVLLIAQKGKMARCTEALIVTGERPETKYSEAREWLKSLGHHSIVDYIREVSDLILRKTRLLPHTNAGSLTKKEMSSLKDTNVSLGVMLESASERLAGKGMPHEMAPSKSPKVRIKTIQSAGELKIPMTTGLLVGIGETPEELIDSLFLLRDIQNKFGHLQEVIMQNFSPKADTAMAKSDRPSHSYFVKCVAVARLILNDMNIQVPPNLNPGCLGDFLDAGINDWGGISPVTIDHVNPEYSWPDLKNIGMITSQRAGELRARLPIYPEFLDKSLGFVPESLRPYVDALVDKSGLVKEHDRN